MTRSNCLVLESLHLVYDLKIGNNKNNFTSNLSKLLQTRIEIKYARETVYETYRDMI